MLPSSNLLKLFVFVILLKLVLEKKYQDTDHVFHELYGYLNTQYNTR